MLLTGIFLRGKEYLYQLPQCGSNCQYHFTFYRFYFLWIFVNKKPSAFVLTLKKPTKGGFIMKRQNLYIATVISVLLISLFSQPVWARNPRNHDSRYGQHYSNPQHQPRHYRRHYQRPRHHPRHYRRYGYLPLLPWIYER